MQVEKIELDETDCFSPLFLDYINRDKRLAPFYSLSPKVENFGEQIKNKTFSTEKRAILSKTLLEQYVGVEATDVVLDNISLLKKNNTYTITTGHQLNIFTGPLYFIYKIATVINACKQLKTTYPDCNFVPVYWMASEDHDFDEIDHFRLDGKNFKWETNQTGAVGRFNPSSIKEVLDQMPGNNELFEKAYLESDTLAESGRKYVNALFGNEGVVVVDADERELKKLFTEVITTDIFTSTIVDAVDKTTSAINDLGYKTQVNARDINFFYLDENLRSRLIFEGNQYKVLDTDLSFNADELKTIIETEPEKLSPNVVLRPLYQETILPNLAYIGGPAEVAYWLQLKPVFDLFGEAFPVLMPRNFALIIDQITKRKIKKTDIDNASLFLDADVLVKKIVSNGSSHDLSYQEQIDQLKSIYENASAKAAHVDPTLTQHLEALHTKASNLMAKAEKKLVRAEKKHHSEKIQQIESIKRALFPNNSLQERTDNFLGFYHRDDQFIQKVLANFDPFDYRFHLLTENE